MQGISCQCNPLIYNAYSLGAHVASLSKITKGITNIYSQKSPLEQEYSRGVKGLGACLLLVTVVGLKSAAACFLVGELQLWGERTF